MNSRERVLAAVEGVLPDRVPCDFYATSVVTENLMCYLKVDKFREVVDRLNIDMFIFRDLIVPEWQGPKPKETEVAPGVTENYLGWRMKKVKTIFGFEDFHCDHIFADAQTEEDIEKFDWPKVDWFDFSAMPEQLDEYSDKALIAASASVFQHPTMVRGLDNFLCDLLLNEDLANYLMDKYTDFYLAYFDRMFSVCKGKISVLRVADDVGMQERALIKVETFQKFVKPRLKKLVDMAHAHGVKLMFHSCGSVVDFIDDIIETGVDILNPIQVRAKDMEPAGIKERFGSRICLHGGVDIQWTMPKGSGEDVAAEVRERIDVMGKGGGYIIGPCHALQQDVPMENIVTMYKTIQEYQKS
ncbi:MAG: hypothetical protein JXD22_00390 [Sedimentisphaerales bacterium]|nr:hypothetical protein [Sedimentisphaerales bacterium]